MKSINAKHIMYPVSYGGAWFGGDFNMNLYKGCCHGCIYCDSRSNCYQIDDFDSVRIKEDAINILHREIHGKRKKGVVGIGAMSDTYNPFEKKLALTKQALELLYRYGYGVSIDTKSNLVVRDKAILKKIGDAYGAIVKFSITTCDDALSRVIEPHVCVSSERLKAMKELADEGIYTGMLIHPTLPFITDTEENIVNLVRLAYEHGAKFVYTMFSVTLRENQRDYFYQRLDESFPGLKLRYKHQFKQQYSCVSPNVRYLNRIFIRECKKYGLKHQMGDIIDGYKKIKEEQMTLF